MVKPKTIRRRPKKRILLYQIYKKGISPWEKCLITIFPGIFFRKGKSHQIQYMRSFNLIQFYEISYIFARL